MCTILYYTTVIVLRLYCVVPEDGAVLCTVLEHSVLRTVYCDGDSTLNHCTLRLFDLMNDVNEF